MENMTVNQRVAGSSPAGGAKRSTAMLAFFYILNKTVKYSFFIFLRYYDPIPRIRSR